MFADLSNEFKAVELLSFLSLFHLTHVHFSHFFQSCASMVLLDSKRLIVDNDAKSTWHMCGLSLQRDLKRAQNA